MSIRNRHERLKGILNAEEEENYTESSTSHRGGNQNLADQQYRQRSQYGAFAHRCPADVRQLRARFDAGSLSFRRPRDMAWPGDIAHRGVGLPDGRTTGAALIGKPREWQPARRHRVRERIGLAACPAKSNPWI